MTRILADLPDAEIQRLDRIAKAEGKSRAAVVREAVSAYRAGPAEPDLSWIAAGFGLWKAAGIEIDPATYERQRRAEWTRPWDDDYEEVRAESPEMFDAEDDRNRQIYLDMVAGKFPSTNAPEKR